MKKLLYITVLLAGCFKANNLNIQSKDIQKQIQKQDTKYKERKWNPKDYIEFNQLTKEEQDEIQGQFFAHNKCFTCIKDYSNLDPNL